MWKKYEESHLCTPTFPNNIFNMCKLKLFPLIEKVIYAPGKKKKKSSKTNRYTLKG